VQRVLDAITGAQTFVRNGRMDILVANRPRATDFAADWEQVAADAVAILRSEAGRDRCDTFRTRWAAHNVRFEPARPTDG
jgi:hypothetical protein